MAYRLESGRSRGAGPRAGGAPARARRSPHRLRRSHMQGFTLLELLVVLGVMSLLISLLLPAVMNARASARRVACMNKLRQLTLAISLHADRAGRLPAAGYYEAKGPRKFHSWVTSILGEIDQGELARQYDFSRPFTDEQNFKLTQTPLPVLACPDDVSVEDGQGNLSYVVNGGFAWTIPVDCPASAHASQGRVTISPLDFNGDGIVCPLSLEAGGAATDLSYLERTSLFFVENWPAGTGTVRHHNLADVLDGLSQTILLSENVRAGYDPQQPNSSWGAPDSLRNMFFVSSYVCESGKCARGKVQLERANDRSQEPFRQECLNASLTQAEGTAPWPSSGHAGRIHVGYCDGHVSSLTEQIDGKVYVALVTPQGRQADDPFAEPWIGKEAE